MRLKLKLPVFMKKLCLGLAVIIIFSACSKDKTNDFLGPNSLGIQDSTRVILTGNFYSTPGITVGGFAKLISINNVQRLILDSFSISSGPDLKVYLSKTNTAIEFINLGPLRNNSGTDIYTIPSQIDFSVYKFVLIHCQQFNHLFAVAELNP